MTTPTHQECQYWEDLYQHDDTRWDLGQAAPALIDWLRTHPGQGKRAIVPGCGRGHDPVAIAQAGYDVTAVDFAPSALDAARRNAEAAGVSLTLLAADLVSLDPAAIGLFDLWFEHTCFCAIDPGQRPAYAATAARLLKPGATLLGIFYTHGELDGPPFDTRPEAIAPTFEAGFEVVSLAPNPISIERRTGKEHLGEFRRR